MPARHRRHVKPLAVIYRAMGSQKKLAAALGIGQPAVSKIVNGKRISLAARFAGHVEDLERSGRRTDLLRGYADQVAADARREYQQTSNRTRMTIHAPDPALEQRAMTELVEAVAHVSRAGQVASQMVIRANEALVADDSPLAHRLQDLAREILNAARRKDRERMTSPRPFKIVAEGEGVAALDLARAMGSEVEG
jgi:predicted transcriptional regulator